MHAWSGKAVVWQGCGLARLWSGQGCNLARLWCGEAWSIPSAVAPGCLQGRIVDLVRILVQPSSVILITSPGTGGMLLERLQRFVLYGDEVGAPPLQCWSDCAASCSANFADAPANNENSPAVA